MAIHLFNFLLGCLKTEEKYVPKQSRCRKLRVETNLEVQYHVTST